MTFPLDYHSCCYSPLKTLSHSIDVVYRDMKVKSGHFYVRCSPRRIHIQLERVKLLAVEQPPFHGIIYHHQLSLSVQFAIDGICIELWISFKFVDLTHQYDWIEFPFLCQKSNMRSH